MPSQYAPIVFQGGQQIKKDVLSNVFIFYLVGADECREPRAKNSPPDCFLNALFESIFAYCKNAPTVLTVNFCK